MAERTTVTQVTQWGIETTPGTAVAATKKFTGVNFTLGPQLVSESVKTAGNKFTTQVLRGKQTSGGKISGMPSYDEMLYLLSSLVDTATITGTTPKVWTFESDPLAEDLFKTFTIEQGSSFRGNRAAYGVVTELGMKGTPTSISVDGSFTSRSLTDPFTMTTAGVTSITQIPINPLEVSVFMDPTSGALGTTKLLRVLEWEWKIGNRFAPLHSVDAAQTSFAAIIETPVEGMLKLKLEADAQGMAPLATYNAGNATQFVRIAATSATANYSFVYDFATLFKSSSEMSDSDGVYAIDWESEIQFNGTWNKAFSLVHNSVATAL